MTTTPAAPAADLEAFFQADAARIQAELYDFLRIPSVSARPEHRADLERAAEWLAGSLRSAGLSDGDPPHGRPPDRPRRVARRGRGRARRC